MKRHFSEKEIKSLWNGLDGKLYKMQRTTTELLTALYTEISVVHEQVKLWTVKYLAVFSMTLYTAIDIIPLRRAALIILTGETVIFGALLLKQMQYKKKLLKLIVKIENQY